MNRCCRRLVAVVDDDGAGGTGAGVLLGRGKNTVGARRLSWYLLTDGQVFPRAFFLVVVVVVVAWIELDRVVFSCRRCFFCAPKHSLRHTHVYPHVLSVSLSLSFSLGLSLQQGPARTSRWAQQSINNQGR